MRPARRTGDGARGCGAMLLMLMVLVGGCSTPAPRFRTGGEARGVEDADVERMAERIRHEEARDDDRKVDARGRLEGLSARKPATRYGSALAPPGLNRDRVLLDVVSYLGVPYRSGGETQEGLDCSGFTRRVYEGAAGVRLPRSTSGQYRVGSRIDRDSLLFGDLVFFDTTGRVPSHVGIYLEDDLFAHASVTYGVTISSLQSTYYRGRYVGARRVMHEEH